MNPAGAIAALIPLDGVRAVCGCGHSAAIDPAAIARRHGRDTSIAAVRRGLRCAWCGQRSRPMLVGRLPRGETRPPHDPDAEWRLRERRAQMEREEHARALEGGWLALSIARREMGLPYERPAALRAVQRLEQARTRLNAGQRAALLKWERLEAAGQPAASSR